MGRTTRWLRSLLGGKKEAKISREIGDEKREKKRWSFKAGRESADIGNNQNIPIMPPVEDGAKWLRTFYSESEKEQNKHAIAVAAATAAAADAAVAAAQAAVAVVRLTGKGRAEVFQQRFAAIKIQTVFRGYLAKKALRALKALVKLQALVRGYLVRKQAAATLQSMQALIRAQSTIRAQKCRNLLANDRRFQPEFVPRKSLERFEETSHSRRLSSNNLDSTSNGYDRSPKIVEIDTCRSKSRSSRSRTSASLIDSIEEMTLNSIPSRISIPDCRNFQEYDWCRFSATAQSTPRYVNSNGIAPATPAKSVCAGDCPNYMTNTRSFEAKVRSQSAPRQRPEPFGPRKRLPLSEVLLESRASLSGVGMQRSCNRIQEAFNFKSAVLDRLDRSVEFGRGSEQELHLQGKW